MGTGKTAFILSIIVFLFWLIGWNINVYLLSVTGAIAEILWLPIVILTVALPVYTFVGWAKEKYAIKSLWFYSLIVMAITGLLIAFVYK